MNKTIPRVFGHEINHTSFNKDYVKKKQPLIIKGLTDQWPAARKWSLSFFADTFPDLLSGCFYLKQHVSDLNGERGSRLEYIPMKDAVKVILQNDEAQGLSVATPLEVFESKLDPDFIVPEYCREKSFLRKRLFISPEGAITTLHQDMFDNLYVVVKGAKKIMLFPPDSPVYPNSRFSKLPNHAQVDPAHPDYEYFPKFKKAKGFEVVVKEGEALYIPSLWWHYLRAESTTIALSIWWTEGWITPLARLAAWYKSARKI